MFNRINFYLPGKAAKKIRRNFDTKQKDFSRIKLKHKFLE